LFPEGGGIGFKGQATANGFRSILGIREIRYVDDQAKAIQELGPQLAFFRIHGSDQDESGRVTKRQSFSLDLMNAAGGRIQKDVHEVIGQQVHLVDVEDAAIGRRQQARLKRTLSMQGLL
jgi:hypothetical protein